MYNKGCGKNLLTAEQVNQKIENNLSIKTTFQPNTWKKNSWKINIF